MFGAVRRFVDVGRHDAVRLDARLLQEFDAAWRPGCEYQLCR